MMPDVKAVVSIVRKITPRALQATGYDAHGQHSSETPIYAIQLELSRNEDHLSTAEIISDVRLREAHWVRFS
jgi:hypothetical protein